MAELLIQHGADVNLRNGFTALTLAMRHSENDKQNKLVKLLLDHGADVVVPTQLEYNPLCASVWIDKNADQRE